jgi:RNA polymerase-binding transcription factor DksA
MKSKYIIILPALALGLAVPAVANEASAKVEANIAEARGDAAKVAMDSLDAEIDRVDALIDNAPTQADKDAAKARMDVLKERRNELRKTYVKARYDELSADVRAEANKFGAWTKRTFTKDPAEKAADDIKDAADDAKDAANEAARDTKKAVKKAGDNTYAYAASAGAAIDLAAYKARPTDTNKEEAKAALKALDNKIDELDDRIDKMPRGADRDAAKRRLKALEDRKDELKGEFNKARFNALVDDVQGEWNQLVH